MLRGIIFQPIFVKKKQQPSIVLTAIQLTQEDNIGGKVFSTKPVNIRLMRAKAFSVEAYVEEIVASSQKLRRKFIRQKGNFQEIFIQNSLLKEA